MFAVPPGGGGVYYFSTYLLVDNGEYGHFDMTLNDDVICTTVPDHNSSGASDLAPGSCSAVVDVVAGNIYFKYNIRVSSSSVGSYEINETVFISGDEVQVVYFVGTDTTPLFATASYLYNGFNGFRI